MQSFLPFNKSNDLKFKFFYIQGFLTSLDWYKFSFHCMQMVFLTKPKAKLR